MSVNVPMRTIRADLRRDYRTDQRVPPSREHGVVHRFRHVQSNSDELSPVLGDVPVCGNQRVIVELDNTPRNKPTAVLGDTDMDRALHRAELRVISGELVYVARICDSEAIELVKIGREQCRKLSGRNAGCSDGTDGEGGVGKEVDNHDARVNNWGQRHLPGGDSLVVCILCDTLRSEGKVGAADWNVLVGFRGYGKNDAVCATTASGQSPEQVGIILTVRDPNLTVAVDHLPF